jgi:hypothetical protein
VNNAKPRLASRQKSIHVAEALANTQHFLGRLQVEALTDDLDTATTLRPRVEHLAWRLMPRVLEDVCGRLAPQSRQITLLRIDLDLGRIDPNHLEQDALRALETQFSDALAKAIGTAAFGANDEARSTPVGIHRLVRFEAYLETGRLPFLAGDDKFDVADHLRDLAAEQPSALIEMLRRRGRERHVLERLVLQLGDSGMQELLAVLAPADAAVIIGLLKDVVAVRRHAPPLAHIDKRPESALHQSLWITTIEFLLYDAGTQFNRRRFLERLLQREANRLGVEFVALLQWLAVAVEQSASRQPLVSSLPGTLKELLLECAAPSPEPDALATRWLVAPAAIEGRGASQPGLVAVVSLLDCASIDFDALVSALGPLTESQFSELVVHLQPNAGPWLIAELRRLEQVYTDSTSSRVRAVALMELAASGPQGIDSNALMEAIVGACVRHFGAPGRMPFAALALHGTALPGEPQATVAELWLAAEPFLATGRPEHAGPALAWLAASNPSRLCEAMQRAATGMPGAEASLAKRLLDRLLPGEILACLAPRERESMMRHADAVARDDAGFWLPLVTALLRGEDWLRVGSGTGLQEIAGPSDPLTDPPEQDRDPHARLGEQFDQFARLGDALDHDAPLPAWAATDLLQRSAAELAAVVFAEEPSRTFDRLWRGVQALRPQQHLLLLGRIAPWVVDRSGPLAQLLAGLDDEHRSRALTRAAVAALHGAQIDLPGLLQPAHQSTETQATLADATTSTTAFPTPTAPTAAPSRAPDDIDRLLAWLNGATVGTTEATRLAQVFNHLADAGNARLQHGLAQARGDPKARARWAAQLPPPSRGRLVLMLVPTGAKALLDGMMLLSVAARQVAQFGAPRVEPAELWALLFDELAEARQPDLPGLLAALTQRLTDGHSAQTTKLQARALHLAQQGGHVSVAAALRRSAPAPATTPPRTPAAAQRAKAPAVRAQLPPSRAPAASKPPSPSEPQGALYVRNAGLVLLNPYLPMLFDRLGLLTPDDAGQPRVDGVEAASRGVHLLQYLADGQLDSPEPMLLLNKLLCGMPTVLPVARHIEATPDELALCDDLLGAVISHWKALGGSSVAALRETFLQREGRLLHGDGRWSLQVQRKTLDVLADEVPWSFGVVFHPWMPEPIHVTW